MLAISSSDGYVSFVRLDPSQLGSVLPMTEYPPALQNKMQKLKQKYSEKERKVPVTSEGKEAEGSIGKQQNIIREEGGVQKKIIIPMMLKKD